MARKELLQEGAPKARFRKAFGDLVPRVLPMRVDSANKGDSQGLHGQTRMPLAFFELFSPAPAPLTHPGTRDGAASTPRSLHSLSREQGRFPPCLPDVGGIYRAPSAGFHRQGAPTCLSRLPAPRLHLQGAEGSPQLCTPKSPTRPRDHPLPRTSALIPPASVAVSSFWPSVSPRVHSTPFPPGLLASC